MPNFRHLPGRHLAEAREQAFRHEAQRVGAVLLDQLPNVQSAVPLAP